MTRIGASSWTAPGWEKVFYPPKTSPREFIRYYSTKYDTVEIDATFYATPARSTVSGWYDRTEPNFIFAAKVPQLITHEKLLENCEADIKLFVDTMSLLKEKLGPLLFQFRYFRKDDWGLTEFLKRLLPALDLIPRETKIAVEVRNKSWLVPELTDPLKERNIALALIDHPYMPVSWDYEKRIEKLVTADFVYVRWLGDRIRCEELIADKLGEVTFEQPIINRTRELASWATLLKRLQQQHLNLFAYFNNHYGGYAPANMDEFKNLLESNSD